MIGGAVNRGTLAGSFLSTNRGLDGPFAGPGFPGEEAAICIGIGGVDPPVLVSGDGVAVWAAAELSSMITAPQTGSKNFMIVYDSLMPAIAGERD